MKPEVPQDLLGRAAEWDELHRWERSELGKALRRLGLTYGEIRELIPVPKGTLSYWCQEITLSDTQIAAIKSRSHNQAGVPKDTQWRRREEVQAIAAEARTEVESRLTDPLWLGGVMLYCLLHLHEGNDERSAREHWTDELSLGDVTWHKTFIKPRGTGHRKNHLQWGVCRVHVRKSTDAWVRTMAWIDGIRGHLTWDLRDRPR